jgi:hypothetical protein
MNNIGSYYKYYFRMKGINDKKLLALAIFACFSLLFFISVTISTTQLTFYFDLNNSLFNLTEPNLNDSSSYKDILFSGNENQTVYIRIPKNSTILYTNMSLLGQLKPVQSSTGEQVWDVAAGNVNYTNPWDEIAIGTGSPSYVKLLKSNGGSMWNYSVSGNVYAVAIGNLSSDEGDEIAAGGGGAFLYLLNSSGQQKWNSYLGTIINDISVGKINFTKDYDQIAVATGSNVRIFDYQGQEIWNYTGSSTFHAISVGNLSSDEGNEIVAGDDSKIYLLNSSGQQKWNLSLGTVVNSIAVGNISESQQYDEIVVAGNNGTVFALDSSSNIIWTFTISGAIANKVTIGDVTSEYSGSEVIVGGSNNKVYILNSTGNQVFTYTTENEIRGVAIGNLTQDPGDEIAVGTSIPATYTLYVLNLEYFPTNPYLDIGGDGDIEWSYSGKFRTNSSVSNNTEFQDFLNSCTAVNEACDVPLVFHSDFSGDLYVSQINITYQYNITDIVSYTIVSSWSRTNNVKVNSSVGSKVKNITYSRNPAVNIQLKYIKINSSATSCDFNGLSYQNSTINGNNVCDISSSPRTIPSSGATGYDTLWDNTMETGVPLILNESAAIEENGFWRKNITIWNNTLTNFTNIIANSSTNESIVIAEPKLRVDWYQNDTLYDITPSISQNNCNSTNPTYSSMPVGSNTFYVCKQDTSGNNLPDLFVWKQPYTKNYVRYEISGSANRPSSLNNISVTPSENKWGSEFNISVNVTDEEGDNVTVRLCLNITNTFNLSSVNISNVVWNCSYEKNTTQGTAQGETVIFNLTSSKTWTGNNLFKFQFADFNGTTQTYYHDWQFSSVYYGPNVTKHDVIVSMIQGNDSSVNRTDSTLLVMQLNDSDSSNQPIDGSNCSFWVSLNDTVTWDWGYSTVSNSSGYCNYTFSPNGSYVPGLRWWKAGSYQDSYYNTNISENFTVKIYGKLSINLTNQSFAQNVTRASGKLFNALLYDEFNQPTKLSNYTCTWYRNNDFVTTSDTNSTGYCNFTWSTDCSSELATYSINVTLSGSVSPYYFLNRTIDQKNITLKANANLNIISPNTTQIFHPYENISLNSTLAEPCGENDKARNITWKLNCTTDLGIYWPPPDSYAYGDNTTGTTCSYPGILNITVNITSDFYNYNQSSLNVTVYGWSGINLTQPLNQTYNRTETNRTINISCRVQDLNVSGMFLENYPVDILDFYNNSYNKLITRSTDYYGFANYTWNISSNTSVPEGWHVVRCNITDQRLSAFRAYNASGKQDNVTVLIIEVDTTPPTITGHKANSVQPSGNTTIEANVTDYYGVSKVWVDIIYPNGTLATNVQLQNLTADIKQATWRVNLTNLTQVGDYDYTLYANDTSNFTSQVSDWFEVFNPIQMYITTDSSIDFTFYRSGTNWAIHNFINSSGSCTPVACNFSLHKRNYDFVAKMVDSLGQTHSIKFNDLNSTNTSLLQFGVVSNITNPLNLSNVSLSTMPLSLSVGGASVPIRTKLATLLVSQKMSFSNSTLTFDYSKLLGLVAYEPAIKIYRCENWVGNNCTSGWEALSSQVNTTSNSVTTTSNKTSLFFAAEPEECGNGFCGAGESCVNCPTDCGQCPAGGQQQPSGGGGGGGATSVCGNLICEFGENNINCPTDCGGAQLSISTNASEIYLNPGEIQRYGIKIQNLLSTDSNVSLKITGSVLPFLTLDKSKLIVKSLSTEDVGITAYASEDSAPGTYTGEIVVSTKDTSESLPVKVIISLKSDIELGVVVESLTKQVIPGDDARFHITLYNLGANKRFNSTLTYQIKNVQTNEVIYSENETLFMEGSRSFIKTTKTNKTIPAGMYSFLVEAFYQKKKSASADTFQIVRPLLANENVRRALILISLIAFIVFMVVLKRKYKEYKARKARYIFPVHFNKLPRGELWTGKVAETAEKSTFSMDDLTTHVLIAGATGSGKSVTGNIFVEELLEQKIPVVVFDPTAQWTGFIKPCTDEKVLRYYRSFGLTKDDAKFYPGMIYEVTDPNLKIDFKRYMNPGEITVFVLNKLKPGEYDTAVTNIINSIFEQGWEESTTLKMVIVFDEVHRLLERYGGKGGYVSLERACREFRKWGIGLIMISQVLSDFKEAIKGNVLTEIQMHTKSLEDLERIEKKYGLEYAKRVTKEEIGIGMMQNPKYNNGIPWFISFRPPLHMPHKIPEVEMEMYKQYADIISKIEIELARLERAGRDVTDLKIEFKLAATKIKQGRFRMAEIYIESLRKRLGI